MKVGAGGKILAGPDALAGKDLDNLGGKKKPEGEGKEPAKTATTTPAKHVSLMDYKEYKRHLAKKFVEQVNAGDSALKPGSVRLGSDGMLQHYLGQRTGWRDAIDTDRTMLQAAYETGLPLPQQHPGWKKHLDEMSASRPETERDKEPHEMTLQDVFNTDTQMSDADKNDFGSYHREAVENAIAACKPVPPEVLADYPDLQPEIGESHALKMGGRQITANFNKDGSERKESFGPTRVITSNRDGVRSVTVEHTDMPAGQRFHAANIRSATQPAEEVAPSVAPTLHDEVKAEFAKKLQAAVSRERKKVLADHDLSGVPITVREATELAKQRVAERHGKKPLKEPPEKFSRRLTAEVMERYYRTQPERYAGSKLPATGSDKWITIGGKKNGDKNHAGGFRVKISGDGTILAGGPKGLQGKNVTQVGKYFDKVKNTPANRAKRSIAIVNRQAKKHGITPDEYRLHAIQAWAAHQEHHAGHEAAKAHARRLTGLDARDIRRFENQNLDHASDHPRLRGFDAAATEVANTFPELGWGVRDDGEMEDRTLGGELWELLKEGKQKTPSETTAEYHAVVDDFIHDRQRQPAPVDLPPTDDGWDRSEYAEPVGVSSGFDPSEFDRFARRFHEAFERITRGRQLVGAFRREFERYSFDKNQPRDEKGRFAKAVSSNVFDGEVGDNFRQKASTWAKRELVGKSFRNENTGFVIKVPKRSIEKTLSHLPDNKPGLALFVLPELLQSAVRFNTIPNRTDDTNIKAWHYFLTEMVIDEVLHETRIKVREDGNGVHYYDQHVTKKK